MTFTLDLPDQIASQLSLAGPDAQRRALEMLTLEGYREERISRGQVGELLGFGFHETEAFLKENGAYITYSKDELDEEMRVMEKLLWLKQS